MNLANQKTTLGVLVSHYIVTNSLLIIKKTSHGKRPTERFNRPDVEHNRLAKVVSFSVTERLTFNDCIHQTQFLKDLTPFLNFVHCYLKLLSLNY